MAIVANVSQASPFGVFGKRAFRLLWGGQLISTIGSALTALAASILVYRLTNSALNVSLMLIATVLPSLLIGLIAGVFVDRLDRKRMMIAADLIRAVLVLLIPFLLPYGIASLYAIVLLISTIGQFYEPAYASALPEVASDDELAAANALVQISSFGSTAIGFAVSGLIASRYPIEWAFYLNALTFLISAACIALTYLPPLDVAGRTNVATVARNLRSGLSYLFDTRILRSLLIGCIPAFIGYGLFNTLLLPFALRELHATEFEYGLMEALQSAGFIVTALLMVGLADRLKEGEWIALSYFGVASTFFLCALAFSVPLAIAINIALGLLNAPNYVARSLVIQRNTTREVRGRVNSVFLVVRNIMYLLGMAAAGLAEMFDARVLLIASSVLVIVTGVLVLVLPGLRQPAAAWRQAVHGLRMAPAASGQGWRRMAMLADLDLLGMRLPALAGLSAKDRQNLASRAYVHELPAGTTIVRRGERSDAAYFILDGRAVAGHMNDATYQVLEELNPGDFFGEIAALTGVPRTADVVAEQRTIVLQVPALTLREMVSYPQFNRLFLSTLIERMARLNMIDLPRYADLDQQSLRELRMI